MVQKAHLNYGWRGPRLALLAASHFMLILDSAVVDVALPSIGRDLHFTQQDISWVPNGYTLLFGGFLILGGRLGDLVGRRRLFVSGLVLFTAASLAGALAPSPGWLIAARGLQGLAAAIISPTALSLVLTLFPNRTPDETARRNKALGVMGAVAAAGGAFGLFAGGVLTDLWGWESIFYVNVPIGLLGVALAARLLPADSIADRSVGFDVVGAVTITGGVALVVFALLSTTETSWLSVRVTGAGMLAAALITAFVVVQIRSKYPLLPLRIFKGRQLFGANAVAGLINVTVGPTYIIVSLYMQQVLGLSPLSAGLALVPLAVTTVISSKLANQFLYRFSMRACTVGGLAVFTCGILWLSRISGGTYIAEIFGPLTLIGLGGGVVFVSFTVAGTAAANERDSGVVSGVLSTSQQIGSTLGLAILIAVATSSSRLHVEGHTVAAALTAGYRDSLVAALPFLLMALGFAAALLPGSRSVLESKQLEPVDEC